MRTLRTYLAVMMVLTACDAEQGDFEDVPSEAPLSNEEQTTLPDGLEAEHNHELDALLAAETIEADADPFDTDEVAPFVDAEVTEDDVAAVTDPAYATLIRSGLHPRASDALRAAGVSAGRITQTIGNAAASKGTHGADGSVSGRAYSAATDISTRGLTTTQIHNLVERLAKGGFAVWYRKGGSDGWNGVNHIHAVYANAKMKSSLRSQVRSWLAGRNGLVSNTTYKWHAFSAAAKASVKAKYAMSQQGLTNGGAGVPGRINTTGASLTIRASASTGAAAVGSVADGAYVTIRCQKRGTTVNGTYGSSNLWDKVAGGYVSDVYVSTGSDGQVAPDCP